MLYDLPDSNPFSPPIRMLLLLVMIQTMTMIAITAAVFWLVRDSVRRNHRMDKILCFIEEWAKLGTDRREEARAIVRDVITAKTEEVKQAVNNIPVVTAAEIARAVKPDV